MNPSSNSSDYQPNITYNSLAKKEERFEAFDFLRAIGATAIIAYKTNVFNIPYLLIPNSFTYALSGYVLSGMIGALAVPVFLQISLFIFYNKSEKTGVSYFIRKRLPRLISLYLFWVGSITIFDILFVGGFEAVKGVTASLKTFVEFIISGNSTPYFFFFSLIFVTVLAEIFLLLLGRLESRSTKLKISYCLLLASSILVFSCSTIQPIINYTGIQSSFLNFINNLTTWDYTPFNFLPYVFTSAITFQEYKEGKIEKINKFLKRKLYFLLFLTVMFFSLEWTLTSHRLLVQVDQAPLDHYMRLSLVFGSWLLLYLALLSKRKVPSLVKFLSYCSLGIYGFHVFFTFKKPLPLNQLPLLGNLFQTIPVLEIMAFFVLVLMGSIALTLLFKKIKVLREFV